MRRIKVAIIVSLVVALWSVTLSGKHQEKKKQLFVDYTQSYVDEATLRHQTLTAPLPVYPEEAIKAGVQGWIDIAVLFDEDGKFKSMKTLDSPGPAISEAVLKALKQWTVKVYYDSPYPESRRPGRTFGELRFHFVIRDGVAGIEIPTAEEQSISSAKFNKICYPARD